MRYFLAIVAFTVLATVCILGFQGTRSTDPPLEVFPDMDRQPRFKPQGENDFFGDGRNERPVPARTVPYTTEDNLRYPFTAPKDAYSPDAYYRTGMNGEVHGSGFPADVVVDAGLMARGRERYDIFCAVCHGASGDSNGITKQYKMAGVPTFHDEQLRAMPEGQIYDTIARGSKNGLGLMSPYASKLSVRDRWAVVAYVRALQRAYNATIDDVPAGERAELERQD